MGKKIEKMGKFATKGSEYVEKGNKLLGHSEHQSGLCFDLNSISDEFADTPEGRWVDENCRKYGLIIRFPKGKKSFTGYKYEPWHLRYVGDALAEKLYNNGDWMTLEEWFSLPSSYDDIK